MRHVIVLIAVLLLALAGVTTVSAAEKETATDLFLGKSDIPSVGGALPAVVDSDPSHWLYDRTGAVGMPYTYTASGRATGTLPGSFTYQEDGIVYLSTSDFKTVVDNQYVSAVFELKPYHSGPKVRIEDTNPAAYEYGVDTSVSVSSLSEDTLKLLSQIGLTPQDDKVTYGYFTFTDKYGTFKGYATPDFTKFIIGITFDIQQDDKHDDKKDGNKDDKHDDKHDR